MTTALVLGRHRKGRPIEEAVKQVGELLGAAGWTVEEAVVIKKRALRERSAKAVKAKVDVIVAVGGDGAVLQVVQAVARSSVALGIVPMGTGNLLAGNLEIPVDVAAAVNAILTGRQRQLDVGRAVVGKDKWFFSVACGIGFDAEVMQATKKASKRRWGKLAYLASAVRNGHRVGNVRHQLELDGVASTMKATQVFVANFGRTGLSVPPRLEIVPDDGLFDVIALAASGPLPGLLAGWEALRQDGEGVSDGGRAFRARARKVKVDADPDRLVEIDGSVVGTTPVKISIIPGALTVLVPGG